MFPAVALIGARQSGKTTLSKALRPDWLYTDLERSSDYNRISHDPEFFLDQIQSNVIIDEAQLLPPLFNALRSAIDEDRETPGRFLVTGSSSPELLTHISESLAGRIVSDQSSTSFT